MAIRLTCSVTNTEILLGEVMRHINQKERVMFLCDAGCGSRVVQRLRVKLSRVRKSLEHKGGKKKHFRLNHDIIPWTEKGLRYDAVYMYGTQDETHKVLELIEDLVGHGQRI